MDKRAVAAWRTVPLTLFLVVGFGGLTMLAVAVQVWVSTGALVAGNVGAAGHMNYTVHGDAVNLAARLEQLNKEHGTDVLIAESIVVSVGAAGFRRIGTVDVRGRATPVTVYTFADLDLRTPGVAPTKEEPGA